MHHTKDKGDLGLVMIIADLTKKNYHCFLPIAEHLSTDLIALTDDCKRMIRFQVKYISADERNRVNIQLKNVRYDTVKGKFAAFRTDLSTFDYYAVYCPTTGLCYYIPVSIITQKSAFMLNLNVDLSKFYQL